MPFRWTINPYRGCTHACIYCFARPTHTYLDFDAGRDFEREIVVKVNTPEARGPSCCKPSWKREHVALGTNTDPYQWVEKRYELLPGVWEAHARLRHAQLGAHQVAAAPARHRAVQADPRASPRTSRPHPRREGLAGQRAAHAASAQAHRGRGRAQLGRHPIGVLIAPLMPGINDSPDQVERILELCAEAGAREHRRHLPAPARRGARGLHGLAALLPPDLVPRYEELYARGAYAPKEERERLSRLARARGRFTRTAARPGTGHAPFEDAEPRMAAPPPEQPTLF